MELNQPENQGAGNPKTAEDVLKVVTQELQSLKDNWLLQLNQDVTHLQAEKTRLDQELEELRSQKATFSQPQTDQQQLWAQQLAQVLAKHLQERLQQQLNPPTAESSSSPSSSNDYNENAYRILSSLDNTLSTTLKALQQDITSYHSALNQQLGRMQSLEQQGEAILEALVGRLKYQLQSAAGYSSGRPQLPSGSLQNEAGLATQPTPEPVVAPSTPPVRRSAFNTGLLLILLSSLALSFQNVVTKIILKERSVWLLGDLGGFITPSPGNSLLILAMRMLLVVPLMLLVAPWIYRRTWSDIRGLFAQSKRTLLGWVIASGAALFLSQFFIYIALGNIPTGVATTIFFIYPTVTILLAWQLFGNRPTFSLILAMLTIYVGVFLSLPQVAGPKSGNVGLGVTTAIASGIAFAVYVILTQVCAQKLKLHPVPFSVINFTTILVLSCGSLAIANGLGLTFFKSNVAPQMWGPLWVGTAVLALTTLFGYLLNNFGVPLIGAALAAVVGATGPALTSILAWGLISENLQPIQGIGIMLVTLWVLGISVERMQGQAKKSAAASR